MTEVLATEPDPHMLRRARGAAESAPVPVRVQQASADALPEIRRVLRPDGRLLFLEHVRAGSPRMARWQDRLERPWGWFTGGCHPNRDTLRSIAAAGFAVPEVEEFDFRAIPPLVRPLLAGVARRD